MPLADEAFKILFLILAFTFFFSQMATIHKAKACGARNVLSGKLCLSNNHHCGSYLLVSLLLLAWNLLYLMHMQLKVTEMFKKMMLG